MVFFMHGWYDTAIIGGNNMFMKPAVFVFMLCCLLLSPVASRASDDGEVGCVTTEWKLVGSNHKVCVFAFRDPDIPGVACYISQAKTGGLGGTFGLAEDPSNFAISCSQVGPIELPRNLPKKANVFKESTSVFFKATRVVRMWDEQRNTLVYLAISKRLIEGSPYNAISTVPLRP